MPNIDYIYYWVQFYNKISQVNTPLFPEQNQYVFQKKHIDIITQMKYILSRTPYQLMDDDKYITAFLEFILTLFKQDNSLAATLLKTYIEVYPEMVSNSFYPTTTQCIYLTSCLYYFRISLGFENWIVSDSSAPYKVSRVLCQIVDVLSVTEMYQYSPELAYHFMWIIDLLPSYQNKIAHELKNIVVRYKKSLSLEFVQQLQYLSSSLSGEASHSLKKAIETL